MLAETHPAFAPGRARSRIHHSPPQFAFSLVRTRVLEELQAGESPAAKLMTVVAPTGYGKTVLQTALYDHFLARGEHCWWLTLDDRDTTVERVMNLLDSGLGAAAPEVNVAQDLLRGDAPVDVRMDALLDRIARLPERSAIFIDNLGYCTDETLGVLLDKLVFATPSSVRLVCSSIAPLPLNLSRAKLQGLVREIGYAELSLKPGEVRQMLTPEVCEAIGDDGVDVVVRQTEGWPAAVRLAQILLSSSAHPREDLARFSGSDEDIADLLNRQVLAGFPAALRNFLLETAHLRSFCVELCRHATGDNASAQHIGLLLKRGVFIIPMDRNKSWYRLHGLFREFLDAEARHTLSAERRTTLLLRSAEWCERSGHWQDAIEYALAAGTSAAADVLERVAALFVRDRGDLRQYLEWIERLQAAGHQPGWEADFWYVWALVFHRRYDRARIQNQRLEQRIAKALAAGENDVALTDLKRRTEVIGVCIETYTDHQAAAFEKAKSWLANLGADDPFNVATVACAAAIHSINVAEFPAARELMRVAQSHIAQAGSAYGSAWVALLNACISTVQGDYATVHQDLRATLSRARVALGANSDAGSTVALVAAKCAVEMGLDDEARELLGNHLQRVTFHGILDTAAAGLEAAVKLWNGTPAEAETLTLMREVAASYPPRLSRMLGAYLVQRLVRLGRLDEAQTEARNIELPLDASSLPPLRDGLDTARSQELLQAARIDLLIALGRLKPAEALIAEQTPLARRDGRYARLVELALGEAVIAICSQHTQQAMRHLTQAISLAAKRGIVRPFRDRADAIAGLVNETSPKSWGFALEEERRFFADICRGLPMGNALLIDELGHLQAEGQLIETPTTRELELLSLVEVGLSNQQLADRLNVSVATVKWHLYNLYTKLGVSSRSAALARARALNLLSR